MNGSSKTINRKEQVKSEVVKNPTITDKKGYIDNFQKWLNNNYRTELVVDGLFGAKTKKAAIKGLQTELNLQFRAKLVIDGIWGSKTKSEIRTVSRGAVGDITRIIQGMLYCLGYDPKGFDGIFGNGCYYAVRTFQGDKNLTVDGICGKNTFETLFK
ncbi:peptidoglycan-binding domain-containing protein [Metabacillus halosaccharovorans]|uniref:peptidoglycan-binding domain-containing protein n=1 Tax=Metabacillus halosaccharovorans TaxID=930124 RepID=UPI002481D1CE|nr:peptidoglycan-binding protein [Metabacillus halosaccharovorans]